MGVVQLPDHLQQVIDEQVAKGNAASEAAFLEQAVLSYAEGLEDSDLDTAADAYLDELNAIADRGIAAAERGEYTLISGPEGTEALRRRLQENARRLVAAKSRNGPAVEK